MTWNLIAQSDAYKAQETVLQAPAAGGDIRIALGFPNTYQVGMSNLGLQVVYSHLVLRVAQKHIQFVLMSDMLQVRNDKPGYVPDLLRRFLPKNPVNVY